MSTETFAFTDRTAWLEQIKNTESKPELHWDVIVIGGGIVGAGILQEATRRGFKTLLIEQKDFAWGTSSRSSKMVHGGLRYIAQGDIKLTKHSLQERERLLKEAPGLVSRMGYYFILRKRQFPGRFMLNILLSFYDWLAGIKDHQYFDAQATMDKFPTLATDKLEGSCYYTDSVVDDARLVLRVIQESVQAGAEAINYVKAKKLIKDPATKQVVGVIIEDSLSKINGTKDEQLFDLKSSVVINATGAWADKLRSEVVNEHRVRPLRGSHLVVAHSKLPLDAALTLLHPTDKRPFFIFPWEGVTVIGTTDLDHCESLTDEARISQVELEYLLLAVSKNFPENKITRQDIISTFSGVRPVITSDKQKSKQTAKSPSKERREHAIWAENALVTASGGKLTTFRLSAIAAINAAMPWLDKAKISSLAQKDHKDVRVFTENAHDKVFTENKFEKTWLQRIIGRYGNNAAGLLSQGNIEEMLLLGNTQFCLAECRWAINNEGVIHLDDLLLRRTRLGLLLNQGARELFPKLAEMFQQELGWDNTKWQDEVTRYNAIWQRYYYLPK